MITGVGFVVTAATGGTGTLPYLYGLAASTGASIVLDGQVQQKIAIADYSGAVDQATYHFPGFGSSRSLVEALSEGNILGALLSSGSLGAEVLPFLRGVRVPGVALKMGAEAGSKVVAGAIQEADRLLIQGTRHFAGESAIEHFAKHGNSIMNVLNTNSYNIVNYLNDANYIIRHGIFVPELNGYVRFIGGPGIKYGFVGINRVTGKITTFHIKKAQWLSLNAPSLGIE